MAVFKCKMCEASLEVTGNAAVVKCEYCGTYQSVTTDETGMVRTVLIESVGNPENLLKRGNMSIEERKWDDAEKYFDRVLDINVEEPRAYIGKLMAENKVQSLDELWDKMSWGAIKNTDNYKKAYRFSNGSLQQMFDEHYTKWAYRTACRKAKSPEISDVQEALRLFTDIAGYEDSGEQAEHCKEKIYDDAVRLMGSVYSMRYTDAKSEFESISGYRDADAKAEECAPKAREEAIKAAEERRREKEAERRAKEEERRRELQKQEYQERKQKMEDIDPGELVQVCIVTIFIVIYAIYKIWESL